VPEQVRLGRLFIANRTTRRAEELVAAFEDLGPVSAGTFADTTISDWDLVINATSTSLTGDVVDLPERVIGPDTICYDLAYSRSPTPFQLWAQQRGARHSYQGWGMLVEQAAESYLLWHGVRPATAPVIGALATL
jgi:shikimate dehydrogenase